MTPSRPSGSAALATREDIHSVLPGIDTRKVLQILELHPTVAELEQASVWLGGDLDVFGAEPPIKSTVSKIVTILTADEEDQSNSRG